ncbi:hypothetical protein KQI63_04600 [bacterium]|nr:hypothetical protein [bacterium]
MRTTLPNITALLTQLRRRQKIVWAGAAWLASIAFVLLLALAITGLEAIAWFDPAARSLLAGLLRWTAALVLLAPLLYTLVLLFRSTVPSFETLARWIWQEDEESHDRLLNALQLEAKQDPNTSADLRRAALEQADAFASTLVSSRFLRQTPLFNALRSFAVATAVTVLALILVGDALFNAGYRLANPTVTFLKPGRVVLALEGPDTMRVVQGEDVELRVRARHARPRALRFLVDEGTGLVRRLETTQDSADTTLYTALLENIQRNARVAAVSGRLSSDTVDVVMIARPRVARVELTLQPPAYTSQEPISLPVGVGEVTALPGTRVQIALEASRPLSAAWLQLEEQDGELDSLELRVDQRNVTGRFNVGSPGQWWVNLTARDGVASDEPVRYDITTISDQYPRVEIRLPEDGALIPDRLVVPLVTLADDDYGISKMRLRYRIHTDLLGPDSVSENQFQGVDLQPETDESGRAIVRGLWPLTDLPLLPTDEVHYFVEAWDNDIYGGPKRARTETRRLVFPSVEELFQLTEQQEQEAGDEMARAREQAEETKRKLEETLTRMKSNPDEMSWEETRALQQTLDRQEEMLQNMDEVANTLEQLKEQAESQNLLSEELLEKYQRLQELMEEIATPEMREAMEKLRTAMEEMDGEQVREALEELVANQDQLMENLDRNLSILERLQMEKRLDELAKRAEDLADRQMDLAQRMEDATSQEAKQAALEQQRIEEELENLAERAEEVADDAAGENNQALADSLNQQANAAQDENLKESMQQSQQSMQQGQPQQAQKPSQQAGEQMQQLAQRMRQTQQSYADQGKQEVGKEMDRLYARILLLSRHQEALRVQSSTLGIASPRYPALAADQEALLEGMSVLEDDVAELMKQSFFVGAPIAGDLQRARSYMETAIERYTDRRPREVTGEQGHALAMMHLALLRLNSSQQAMQNSSSGTGYQEMMESLQQMAQQQQQLNQGSQSMQMPMPGSQPGSRGQMMRQMAARQRALAEQMRQLERQSQNQSMEEMLGSLDGLGDAMDQVAKDLEDQSVTSRTKRLQQRIVQRLLDSQRSLQEREYSRQRTGRVAEGGRISAPGELPPEEEDLLRERMLRALDGDYSRPWRETIRDYFRALERDRGAAVDSTSSR